MRSFCALVVDDDRDCADSMALLLGLHGHETLPVYDGPIALELAARETFDVVVYDLAMPGMNGHDMACRLRFLPGTADGLLVCVSGYSEKDFGKGPSDYYLLKPLDLEKFLRLVSSRKVVAAVA